MRYALLSMFSGLIWGGIACLLGASAFRPMIAWAVLASPLVGLAVGLCFRWMHRVSTGRRVLGALASLYFAAILFGLCIGVADLARGNSRRIPIEVVLQAVPAVLWGLTFTGYFLILWPLAYLNHHLLGRFSAWTEEDSFQPAGRDDQERIPQR